MRGIHAEMWCGVDWKSNSSRHRTDRSALNSRLDQNVQHRGATDANLARHVSGRASRLVQLHHALADTLGRATFRDDRPASESSGRRTKLNGGVVGVLSQGHHKRLTRNITQVNVGAALRELLLEGVLVAGESGGNAEVGGCCEGSRWVQRGRWCLWFWSCWCGWGWGGGGADDWESLQLNRQPRGRSRALGAIPCRPYGW